MMMTAFRGYVLPWGQMSYWAATVITNLFSAFPWVGDPIVTWLWGGFSVDNPTLNRFYVLHYLLPFVIFGVVFVHLWALHAVKSNNPLGIEAKTKQDTIPFHPYYTAKDFFGFGVFFLLYFAFVFFAPDFFGEPDNYIPANSLVTPPHIVPEWYFLPFYAILRAFPQDVWVVQLAHWVTFGIVDAKFFGVLAMFGAIAVLALGIGPTISGPGRHPHGALAAPGDFPRADDPAGGGHARCAGAARPGSGRGRAC